MSQYEQCARTNDAGRAARIGFVHVLACTLHAICRAPLHGVLPTQRVQRTCSELHGARAVAGCCVAPAVASYSVHMYTPMAVCLNPA